MSIQMRARYDKINFFVSCGEENHTAVLSLTGDLESSYHSFEEELVMELLGGNGSECSKISKIYKVALQAYRAEIGLEDPKGVIPVSADSYWRSESQCSLCNTRYGTHAVNTLKHFASVEHLAQTNGIGAYTQIINRVLSWFRRNNFQNQNNAHRRIRNIEDFKNYTGSNRFGIISGSDLLTTRFVDLASHFTVVEPNAITKLRHVSTVDRLSFLIENLGENRIARIRRKLVSPSKPNGFVSFLSANRTVSNEIMLDFMSAGIYANIYTYSKYGATAHQATRVYNATNGTKTLKDYLLSGVSPLDAVRDAESQRLV